MGYEAKKTEHGGPSVAMARTGAKVGGQEGIQSHSPREWKTRDPRRHRRKAPSMASRTLPVKRDQI